MTGGWDKVLCCDLVWKMASNRAENYQLYFLIVKVLNKQGSNHFQNLDRIISSFCGRELALRPQTSLRKSWQIPIEDCCHPGLNILRTSPDHDDDDDDENDDDVSNDLGSSGWELQSLSLIINPLNNEFWLRTVFAIITAILISFVCLFVFFAFYNFQLLYLLRSVTLGYWVRRTIKNNLSYLHKWPL